MRETCYGIALLPPHAEGFMVEHAIVEAYRAVTTKIAEDGAVMVGPLRITVEHDVQVYGNHPAGRADVVRAAVLCERRRMIRPRAATR